MKRIVELYSSDNLHAIDLEDISGSAVFVELGGSARISEGPIIKAGFSIRRQDIQGLESAQANGVVRILLHYTEEGKPVTHLLGETEDTEAAKAWIERVNQIYKRKKK